MSYNNSKDYTIPREFKQLFCHKWNCEHNRKPECALDMIIELDEYGTCIFKKEVKK